MPLFIKDLETETLARELARKTGETIPRAIRQSLFERLQRISDQRGNPAARENIMALLRRVDALPVLDQRSADEIIGYDENGVPARGH